MVGNHPAFASVCTAVGGAGCGLATSMFGVFVCLGSVFRTQKMTEVKESSSEEDLRFERDLEFVQSLANPRYLNRMYMHLQLCANKHKNADLALYYMDNPQFIEYLRYLQYWKQPEYARFIMSVLFVCAFKNKRTNSVCYSYPICLKALTLILSNPENAAKMLKNGMFCEHLLFQQRCAWQEANAPTTTQDA